MDRLKVAGLTAALIAAYLFAIWLFMAATKPCVDDIDFMRALVHPEETCIFLGLGR